MTRDGELDKYMSKKHRPPHRKQIMASLLVLILGVVSLLGILVVKANLIQIKRDFNNEVAHLRERIFNYPKSSNDDGNSINAKTIPVLVYHGIINNKQEVSDFAIPQELFREQMTTLYGAGYRTITIKQYKDFMEGKISLPVKSFLLTFDDGRRDSYYGADPILNRLKYTAVMFTASGQSADSAKLFTSYYLNPLEIVEMSSTGRWEIQSHGNQSEGGFIAIDSKGAKEYFLSNKKWIKEENRLETDDEYRARLWQELEGSKTKLEEMTKQPVFSMSYPFSDYGQQSRNNIGQAEVAINDTLKKVYEYAFQQQWSYEDGFVGNHPLDDRLHMRRIEPAADWTGEYLQSFLDSGQDVQPTTTTKVNFKNDLNRWKSSWGQKEIEGGNLILKTKEGRISSFTLLDGSRAWQNYKFSVRASLHDAGAFAVYSNLERPGTGVRCSWKDGSVTVEKMVDGKIVKRSLFSSGVTLGNHEFSIVSTGKYVGCIENGKTIAALKDETENFGGVGVEFWSKNDQASAELTDAEVDFDLTDIDLDLFETKSRSQTRSLVSPISIKSLTSRLKEFVGAPLRYLNNKTSRTSLALTADKWGLNNSSASYSTTSQEYTLQVSGYTSGAGYLISKDIVPSGSEYELNASYKASVPAELLLEYQDAVGQKKWMFIMELPRTAEWKETKRVIVLPKGARQFNIVYQLKTNGVVSVKNLYAEPLKDGSFDKGYVTLTFDDGYSSFITKAYPILKKYNMTATIPVITGTTNLRGYLTPDDLVVVQKAGFEISSHTRTYSRLVDQTSTKRIEEIVGSAYDLKEAGFSASTFVYPYGSLSADIVSLVQRAGYKGARSTIRGYNTKNTDKFLLKDQIIQSATQVEDLARYLDTAASEKQWVILEFHRIDDSPNSADKDSITTAQLESFVKRIKDSGLEIITLEAGVAKMK